MEVERPKRKCIFCGCGGLTKEDYLPKWLNNYVPKDARPSDHAVESATVRDGRITVGKTRRGRLLKQVGVVQKTLRIVCGSCNGGWMSRMHTTCKPLIVPYINESWLVLNKSESFSLAAWVTMHVMVREFATNQQTITPEERRDFYIDRCAPENWTIWIAQHSGPTPVTFSSIGGIRDASPVQREQATFLGHTHMSYVIAGRLIFHCIGTHRTEALSFIRGRYSKTIGFLPIWDGGPVAVSKRPPILTDADHNKFVLGSARTLSDAFTKEFS